MTAKLLIVEDDPEITSALIRGLALIGYHAEAESRVSRALARMTGEPFSGAIVDVMLGADSGLDLVRAVRAAGVTFPIIMLSALSEVEDRAAGLAAGADDYVVKPFNLDEFLTRLQVQHHRAATQRTGPARLDPEGRTLIVPDGQVRFTQREYELLDLLLRNPAHPLSRGAIFDALWSGDGSSNDNVVDVYIGYLRKKLQTADFGFEIKTIRNRGFRVSGQIPRIDRR